MPSTQVFVTAPARLHMGFIDLSGSLGRHFGSIGVALNEICTRLSVTQAPQRRISGPLAERAENCLTHFSQAFNVSDQLHIEITAAIPEHVGLGSGTQMSLAIGSALNAYYGLGLTVRDIAAVMDRGQRSGIGIGVFECGGLVVDGGRGENTITPPIIAHLPLPTDWRFILVFDARGQGLHGPSEVQAFKTLPPFSQQEAARLCYLLMMQGLPAVAENDLQAFGDVVTQLQRSVGEHFATVQGGMFTSPEVAEVMQWLAEQGAVGIGQTSWGPTGFCVVAGIDVAELLLQRVQQQFTKLSHLRFQVVSVRSAGAVVEVV